MAAAPLLERVDRDCGKRLRALAALKPPAHYGTGLLTDKDRVGALRDAEYLISRAARRTGGSSLA